MHFWDSAAPILHPITNMMAVRRKEIRKERKEGKNIFKKLCVGLFYCPLGNWLKFCRDWHWPLIDLYLIWGNVQVPTPAWICDRLAQQRHWTAPACFVKRQTAWMGRIGFQQLEGAHTGPLASFQFSGSAYFILRLMPRLLKLRINRWNLLRFHPWFPVNLQNHLKFKTLSLILKHSMSHLNEGNNDCWGTFSTNSDLCSFLVLMHDFLHAKRWTVIFYFEKLDSPQTTFVLWEHQHLSG